MDGGMTLGMTMQAIPEEVPTDALVTALMAELQKRNVVFGVDEDALRQMLTDGVVGEEVEVAHGQAPRGGKDSEMELLLLPPSFVAQAADGARVDYKNIENVSPVKVGDVISRKTPADPGEPGINVFGKPVRPPAVKDAKHPAGRNTTVSPDGLEMSAAVDGFLRWNEHKIDVLELYSVGSDVDLHTGNVRYDHDVEVFGDVKIGFEVLAGGSVHIYGSIEGGKVVSETGTVTVDGGVMGSEGSPAHVTADGDVLIGRARFARIESKSGRVIANFAVEHAEIHAAGDLILRAGPAMNCVVEVGGKVDVTNVSSRQLVGHEEVRPAVSQAAGTNRREYLRVFLSPPAKMQVHGEKPSDVWEGEVMDLSAGGVRVRMAEKKLREWDSHRVQFTLDGVQGTLWMDAQIVRTCEPPPSNGTSMSYGLKFTQIEPAVRETIARFCMAEDLRQHRLAKSS
jgi:hypothetical protein